METRPRTRLLRRAVITAALGALVVPASAGAATKTPVITKVTPKNVAVGETLTIHGKNFRSGKAKNTVLFKRDGGKALFVKAGLSTKKKIMVVIPKTLEKYMAVKSSKPTASRFRLRVLTTKLSKRFTSVKSSPVVGPQKSKGDGSGGTGGGPTAPTCPVGGPNGDDDGDLLANFNEVDIKTDPCKADTDGDGIWDSYEYWSALDLNRGNWSTSLPYAGQRPYPNPLDKTDADTDHDGDVLTLAEEFKMWADPRYGNKSTVVNYSAGKQVTVAVAAPDEALLLVPAGLRPAAIWTSAPTLRFLDVNRDNAVSAGELLALDVNHDTTVSDTEFTYQDLNDDDVLGDDERDIDADGLVNYDEQHGRMLASYWKGVYDDETPYTAWVAYEHTEYLIPDTDGDGVLDALDDQDHDSFSNISELSRSAAQTDGVAPWDVDGRVNPLNPCLPATADPIDDGGSPPTPLTTSFSPTCMRHPPITNGPAPFGDAWDPDGYDIKN
jgi:hypothetical protein